MKGVKLSSIILPFLLVSLFVVPASAQSSKSNGAEAAAKLRAMFFARDFEGGYVEGKKLVQQYPDAVDVKVWFILNGSRSERADEMLALAEELKAADEKRGWAWFAFTLALNYSSDRSKEALAASEKMLTLLPDNDDAIWLRATAIRQQGKIEDALAFIEENKSKVKNPAELFVIKASALYSQYLAPKNRDEAKMKASMDAFADALKADPKNVNALYLQSSYLISQKKITEAQSLLKKALSLAPNSTTIHSEYWRTVNAVTDVSPEAKQKEIESDIKTLLQNRGNYAGALLSVARQYETLKLYDKKKKIEDQILQLHPISREAEWVLIGRARKLSDEIYEEKEKSQKDPAKQKAYMKMLRDYISRPQHFHKGLLGETYGNLFFNIKDDTATSNAELLTIAQGMIKYDRTNIHNTYPVAAITFAERKTNFREAEAMAREGIVEAKKKVESQREFYDNDVEFEKSVNRMTGMMYDALGWVFFNEGRTEEAEKELLQAYSLNAEDVTNLYHIGQFYQSKKDYAKAEEYYIKGSLVQTPAENKSVGAMKGLYELRNGSLEGYDKYLLKVEEIDAANRKIKILADRIKEPKLIQAFNLKTLDGKMLSSGDLKGKVVVINYWGIWCGWCVKEMPDFQKLSEKYKNDADVAILTINNDQNPADVPEWMKKNKYDFSVIYDDGYVSGKANVSTFPTTWFIDKEGRIAFVKVGWTKKLTEEFSWRIDALRNTEAAAK